MAAGEIDGMQIAAKQKIDEGFDYVIFGHTHQRSFQKFNGGNYINLGSLYNKYPITKYLYITNITITASFRIPFSKIV